MCITKSHEPKSHLTLKIFRHPRDAKYPLLIDGNGEELFNYPNNYCYQDLLNTELEYEVLNSSMSTRGLLSEYDYLLSSGSSIRDFNFGHFLWEYLMTSMSLAEMFGFNRRTTVLLNVGSGSQRYEKYDKLIGMRSLDLTAGKQVCVASVAIGDHKCLNRMWSHTAEIPSPTAFKRRFNEEFGADPQGGIKFITLMRKRGRRIPLNFDEIVTFLQKRFAPIQVKVLDILSTSISEQIDVLRRTFLLITPAGGISCAAPLLPHHSIVLQLGFFNTLLNTTVEYDSGFFAEFNHFSHHVMPLLLSEIDNSTCSMSADDGQQYDWGILVYCSYWVNLTRLERMVAHLTHEYALYNLR